MAGIRGASGPARDEYSRATSKCASGLARAEPETHTREQGTEVMAIRQY